MSPVCPSGRSVSGTGCKKVQIPAHVFEIRIIYRFPAEIRNLMAGKCTLTDAFGRQNSIWNILWFWTCLPNLQNTAMCVFLLGDFWRVSKPYPEPVLEEDRATKEA
jgi:hypothetical protein